MTGSHCSTLEAQAPWGNAVWVNMKARNLGASQYDHLGRFVRPLRGVILHGRVTCSRRTPSSQLGNVALQTGILRRENRPVMLEAKNYRSDCKKSGAVGGTP